MMDIEQFHKLLCKSQEEKHTILCEMDNAFLDYISRGPIIKVYAFPGTKVDTPEGVQVATYLPFAGKLSYVPVEMLRPIKKAKAMPNRMREVQKLREESVSKLQDMNDCLEQLARKDPLIAIGIYNLLQGMEQMNSMDDDMYRTCSVLVDEAIKLIGEHSFLVDLKSTLGGFKEYVDRRDRQLDHVQEVNSVFKRCEETRDQHVPEIPQEQIQAISEKFQEELGLSKEEVRDVVHVRVLVTAMLLAQREFFTHDEILAAVKKYRPEIAALPKEAVTMGIQNGIEKAQQGVGRVVPPALIEKNVMEQFSLTKVGSEFAYYILKNM